MTDCEVPDSIRAAIMRQPKRRGPLHGPAATGDICFAHDDLGKKHLVYVKSIDAGFAIVHAAHTMSEMTGPYDLLMLPSMIDHTYPVIVQTDVTGVVYQHQLGPTIASIPAVLHDRIIAVADGHDDGDGPTFGGLFDRRSQFKRDEADKLNLLCGNATVDAWNHYDNMHIA